MDLYERSPKISNAVTIDISTSETPKRTTVSNKVFDEATPITRKLPMAKSTRNAEKTPTSIGITFQPRKLKLDGFNEVENLMQIDDPNSEEQWNRRPKKKFSYIDKLNLRKINKIDNQTELNKILEKTSTNHKTTKNKSRKMLLQMKNNLIDNPATYLAPKINFVISAIGKLVLQKVDYETLQESTQLSVPIMQFLFAIFQREANKVQFEISKTSMIVDNSGGLVKNNKDIFVGALFKNSHYTLVIINCKSRCFSFIDPESRNPPEADTIFENFKSFIIQHNRKYIKNKMPEDNWRIVHLQHHLQEGSNDSGVFVINFVKQYITTGKIDRRFAPREYRVHLQHFILQKSK